MNKFGLKCVEILLLVIIWLLYLTCRVRFNSNKLPKEPCEVLFWHGRLAMMSFAYREYWLKSEYKKSGKVIISDHKDGEIITRIISHFGIGAVRGSSRKGGAKVLINAFRQIDDGVDIIITPDGPRGPYHSVADGAITIAQKKNLDIYVLNYECSNFWQLKSWDKMIIPKPFSRINYTLSEPFSVTGLDMENARAKIKENLLKSAEI